MSPQQYDWTCSICSITWCLNSMDVMTDRSQVGTVMGYPNCVNETYGCMSTACVVNCFTEYGYKAVPRYVTFDQAYALASYFTGTINPNGMYHFMGIRGVDNGAIWVANSAPGYRGVWDHLSREQFNALGPVEVCYLESKYS